MAVAARKKTAPRLDRAEATLALGDEARIVVVADTHSAPHPRTKELVAREKPSAILHAGDIGDLGVLRDLETIAPLFAVRGNIDARARGVPDLYRLDLRRGDATLLRLLMLHIAVAGPRLRADARAHAQAEGAGMVVCGHSHVPFATIDRGIAVFNPGSIGPRRFILPIVFGVIDVTAKGIALRHMSCETGDRWMPPG